MSDLTESLVLERWFFADPSGQNIMAFLASAFDASYDHPNNGGEVAVTAGLVGRAGLWSAVEDKWRSALSDWPQLQGSFHLTDLRYKLGFEMASVCELQFGKIIGDSGLDKVAGVVAMGDFKTAKVPPEIKQPHYLSMYLVLTALHHHVSSPSPQPCVVMVDNDYGNAKGAAAIHSLWCEAHQVDEEDMKFGGMLGGVQKQCADLVAGAIRRSNATRAFLRSGAIERSGGDRLMEVACPDLRMSIYSNQLYERALQTIANRKAP